MGRIPDTMAVAHLAAATATGTADAVVTIPAPTTDGQIVISQVIVSFRITPPNGLLTITGLSHSDGSAVTFTAQIASAGVTDIGFKDRGIHGAEGTAVEVRLSGGTVAKALNVVYKTLVA